jgi:hypothetical protein
LPPAHCAAAHPALQGFDSTQGKKHDDAGAVKLKSNRGARQFMNRRVRPRCCCPRLPPLPSMPGMLFGGVLPCFCAYPGSQL